MEWGIEEVAISKWIDFGKSSNFNESEIALVRSNS